MKSPEASLQIQGSNRIKTFKVLFSCCFKMKGGTIAFTFMHLCVKCLEMVSHEYCVFVIAV